DGGEEFRQRVPRGGGVKQQLCVDDVLVAVGIKREDAHTGAELEVDYMDRPADTHEQISSAEGVRNGRKGDALLEVEFSSGRLEERVDVGESRPQRVLNIVARDRVAADNRADEVIEGARIVDQKSHSRVERGAALGVARGPAQVRGYLRDELDRSRAANDARRAAAAEWRMSRLQRGVHNLAP